MVVKIMFMDIWESVRFVGQIVVVDQVDFVVWVSGFLEEKVVFDGLVVKEKDYFFMIEKVQYEVVLIMVKVNFVSVKVDVVLKVVDEKWDRDFLEKGYVFEVVYEVMFV